MAFQCPLSVQLVKRVRLIITNDLPTPKRSILLGHTKKNPATQIIFNENLQLANSARYSNSIIKTVHSIYNIHKVLMCNNNNNSIIKGAKLVGAMGAPTLFLVWKSRICQKFIILKSQSLKKFGKVSFCRTLFRPIYALEHKDA